MESYLNRLSALSKEKTYTLNEEGIADETGAWKYSDIKHVQLKFTPTRYYGGIYQCVITSQSGEVTLSNRRYKGPADFDYQNEAYNRFVKELHKKLESIAGMSFGSGMSRPRFMLELIGSLIFFPLIVYAIFALGQALVGGLILLVLAVRLIPYYRKNKPRSYRASEIPDDLLP